jgi:glyoxylase-like metal-dependent hydrolase (beta-lactamase superfamily II)
MFIILLAVTSISAVQAQYTHSNEPAEKNPAAAPLHVKMVKTGLFLISGGGSNSVLRLSANGSIIVDGKTPGSYEALLAEAKKISDQPIRILINTNHHPDHTATNAQFLEDGTNIVAQENAAKNLSTPPTKTYDRELTIRVGGIEAELLHFGNAHTNGDTVVYFPNLKAVAVGDLFAAAPDPDYAAGGSLVEWGPVLDQILKLDFDTVVPASGSLVGRAELEAFRLKLGTLISRATELIGKGVPKNKLMAQLKTDDLGWRLSYTGSRLDHFYAELTSGKRASLP